MTKTATMMRTLSIALLATACASTAPPQTDPLTASCLAPLRTGEPDPSVRNLALTVVGSQVSFTACIVSQRHRRLAHAQVEIAVASAPSGEAVALLGDERSYVSMVQDPIAGMPRLVVMVARSTSWRGGPMAYTSAVRLRYRTCQDTVAERCAEGAWYESIIAPPHR